MITIEQLREASRIAQQAMLTARDPVNVLRSADLRDLVAATEALASAVDEIEYAIAHLEMAEESLNYIPAIGEAAIQLAYLEEENQDGSLATLMDRLIDIQDCVREVRWLLSLAYSITEARCQKGGAA